MKMMSLEIEIPRLSPHNSSMMSPTHTIKTCSTFIDIDQKLQDMGISDVEHDMDMDNIDGSPLNINNNNNNNINDNNNALIPTSSTSPIINGEIELKPMSSRPNIATTPVALNNSDQPLNNE
mmetsp:Transcript_43556/g.53456  ORF Transcript_43556/g.53456 Transcript_43556/m.53456 type:complete len:122 (+) Transcript_43556:31-396(+)